LINKPIIGNQIQSDWAQTNMLNPAYIANKPTKLSDFENDVTSSINGNGDVQINGGLIVNNSRAYYGLWQTEKQGASTH
jgi:hypothetical protein